MFFRTVRSISEKLRDEELKLLKSRNYYRRIETIRHCFMVRANVKRYNFTVYQLNLFIFPPFDHNLHTSFAKVVETMPVGDTAEIRS